MQEIFYTSAHTGVIYDYVSKTQKLLQGHCNQITATACSDNKRWVVTADKGDDSMLVVWDSLSGTPVRTFQNPHPGGVETMDLSADNQYIVTLGADTPQTILLWDWTNEKEEGPICSMQFVYGDVYGKQFWVKFNPDDPYELCSNGKNRVVFYHWEPGNSKFTLYSPRAEQKDFSTNNSSDQKANSSLTKTVFLSGAGNGAQESSQAVTGTTAGEIYVWDRTLIVEGIGNNQEKRLIKVVQFNTLGGPQGYISINTLLTVDNQYLVVGNSDGSIRFYDYQFKVKAWFEDLNLATVKSISFSKKTPIEANVFSDPHDQNTESFSCSDFIVADSSAFVVQLQSTIFEEIDKSKKKGVNLMHGIKSSISAIAVHPTESILAIASSEGFILLWDYIKRGDPIAHQYEQYTKDTRERKKEDKFADKGKGKKGDKSGYDPEKEKERERANRYKLFTCIEFTPDGTELLVGQSNGFIQVIDPTTGQYKKMTTDLQVTESSRKNDAVKQIVVSSDGVFFATSDTNNCVCLFKKADHISDPSKPKEWQFYGKIMSHAVEITSICFGESLDENDSDNICHRLFSIGRDRKIFEYNVHKATYHGTLQVKEEFSIELEAHPTACIWYPPIDNKEGLILTANDEYKIKLWEPSAKSSRRTCLGPTYGGEIVKLKLLNFKDREDKYLIYSTAKKVIGLIKLPLDGNPHKTMGLIAHPDEVSDICTSSDGRFIFTCGGDDLAVNMWQVDVSPIEQAIALGGEGIDPFINLIEGGRDGQTFQDMNDFFYYAMIRSKEENTTKTRKLDGKVPVEQIPYLMRAMGYYPTQQEERNMIQELRFSVLADKCEPNTHVPLDTFIQLFVNHRPVYGIGKNNIEEAFNALIMTKSTGDYNSGKLSREELISAL